MPRRSALLPPLLSLLLSACASSPSGPKPGFQSLSGNWNARLHPLDNLVGPVQALSGALQSSGTKVSGVLHITGSTACAQYATDVPVTGTIDVSGALSLTFPLAGGTATLTDTMSSNLNTLALGELQIAGGTCNAAGGSIGLQQIAPLTGTYQGTLSTRYPSATNLSTNVTAVLTQSSTPDADGLFPVNGTVTSNGDCNATLPIQSEAMLGDSLLASSFHGPLAPIQGSLTGTLDPTNSSLSSTYTSGTCSKEYFGTLTRQ